MNSVNAVNRMNAVNTKMIISYRPEASEKDIAAYTTRWLAEDLFSEVP